ncbi:N-acetylglucosamine kinase [Actinocatenispora thailandica]|uniref:N-acetylglucosamine kinase n=2 Tax=Actinocatenispora thailandica TaxID=227318 RepID=A0A7R7DSV8_9ACTN|nr:N-acetylglucosamine kinase [Actinocatenispora thailandica]
MRLALGLDMGGTATRAVLAAESGVVLGTGAAGPGNPFAHAPEGAAGALREAVRAALGDHDPAAVGLGVLGVAGGNVLTVPAVGDTFRRAWGDLGLRCPMRVVSDVEVAYAAGTAEPDGTILIAGTGTAAGRITGHRMTRAFAGYGWLLGDEGAGFWLGREAVRALLMVTDGLRPPGMLTDLVAAQLPVDPANPGSDTERTVSAVDHAHPLRLARLASLVSTAAEAGDPVAEDIVERAGRHLFTLATAAYGGGPLVLSGSVIRPATPVGAQLRRRLAGWSPGPHQSAPRVLTAGSGAAGAAWLATAALPGITDPAALHRSIVGTADEWPAAASPR